MLLCSESHRKLTHTASSPNFGCLPYCSHPCAPFRGREGCVSPFPLSGNKSTSCLAAPNPPHQATILLFAGQPGWGASLLKTIPWEHKTLLPSVQSSGNLALTPSVPISQTPCHHNSSFHTPCNLGHGSPVFPFFCPRKLSACDGWSHSSQSETMRITNWRHQGFAARMPEQKGRRNLGQQNMLNTN